MIINEEERITETTNQLGIINYNLNYNPCYLTFNPTEPVFSIPNRTDNEVTEDSVGRLLKVVYFLITAI